MARHKVYYKGGRWWLPWSLGCDESCESVFVRDEFVHQKCSSYTLTNLLFCLCKFVWVSDLLINLPSPHPKALARPSTPKVLRAKERTPTPPSIIFTLGLIVESIKEFGGASHRLFLDRRMLKGLGIDQIEIYWNIDIDITKLVGGVSCSYRCIFVNYGGDVVSERNKEEWSTNSVWL